MKRVVVICYDDEDVVLEKMQIPRNDGKEIIEILAFLEQHKSEDDIFVTV